MTSDDSIFSRLFELFQSPGPVNWRLADEVRKSLVGAAEPVDPEPRRRVRRVGDRRHDAAGAGDRSRHRITRGDPAGRPRRVGRGQPGELRVRRRAAGRQVRRRANRPGQPDGGDAGPDGPRRAGHAGGDHGRVHGAPGPRPVRHRPPRPGQRPAVPGGPQRRGVRRRPRVRPSPGEAVGGVPRGRPPRHPRHPLGAGSHHRTGRRLRGDGDASTRRGSPRPCSRWTTRPPSRTPSAGRPVGSPGYSAANTTRSSWSRSGRCSPPSRGTATI